MDKLNSAIRDTLTTSAVSSIMQRDGYFPDNRNTQEINTFFQGEVARMKEAVKAAKIEAM
jgi:tripartite-type tricarboxylate transporter receptor subunit TctC